MKILHTIPGLDISSGGPTTCTYNLLKGLRSNEVEADVLTFNSKGENAQIIGDDSFIKLVDNDAIPPLLFSKNFNNYLYSNKGYDLYHANALWTLPSHMTIRIANKNNRPVVLAPHGMLYPQALKVSRWKKELMYHIFQKGDLQKVSCIQATCMEEVNHIRSLNIKTPVAIVPNCLNLSTNCKQRLTPNNVRRFGFIGRLHPIKNIHLLLECWKSIGSYTHECELVIIGSGDAEYEAQLRKFVSDNRLNNVKFEGFIAQELLKTIIPQLDYIVLPSKSENFGMVVPEALINGVPVLASKGTPWAELDSHQCGWWFNQEDLSDTLIKAILLPENKRMNMGKRGQELVRDKYSMNKVSLQMKQLYSWIISKASKPDFVIE